MKEKIINLPKIPNINDRSFKIVLKYIYTGRISEKNLSIKILLDIMKISEK